MLSSKLNFSSKTMRRLSPCILSLFSKTKTKTTHHYYYNTLRSSASTTTALAHSFSDPHLNFKQCPNSLYHDPDLDDYSPSYSEMIMEMCYSRLDNWWLELDALFRDIIVVVEQESLFEFHDLFEDLLEQIIIGETDNQSDNLVTAFDVFLNVFASLNMFQHAIDLLFQTKSYRILPNLGACSFLINRLIKNGKVDMTHELLQAYRGSLVPIEVLASYTTLIRWFCNNMEVDKAESMLLDMENQGIVPHVHIYSPLICAYCRIHNFRKALDLLGDMDLNSEIACCILHCFLREMDSFVDIKHYYTTLIGAYCLQGKPHEAYGMFKEMMEKGFTPDAVTYTIIIKSYCSMNCLKEANDLLQDMMMMRMRRREITPHVITYTVLLDWSLKKRANIWRDHHLKDVVIYSVLIDGHINTDNLQDAITLFDDEVIDRGLEPDTATHTALISGFNCRRGRERHHTKNAVGLIDQVYSEGADDKRAFLKAKAIELIHEVSFEEADKRGILKARRVQFHKCINWWSVLGKTQVPHKLEIRPQKSL